MTEILHHYNSDHNETSARVVVPFVTDLLSPKSVVDVGCGLGQWLKVFKDHGVSQVVGIDGPHVPVEKRLVSPEEFVVADLLSPPQISTKFDLVVCLEVAEHLPPVAANSFCDFLCSLGDDILFSAAITGQTGENHLNEQPHEYWHERFRANGFEVFDALRPVFWLDDRVNWWYRQNMYLFSRTPSDRLKSYSVGGFTAIHPHMFAMYESRIVSLMSRSRLRRSLSKWLSFT